jgi:two-component system, OmpR family, phosphate regulon sensor histidine kinase PhoR
VRSWRDQVLEIEQQHSRFIQAVQATPNGVVMLNEDDQIEWCNGIAEQHFGINAKRDAMQRVTHILRKPASCNTSFVKTIVSRFV